METLILKGMRVVAMVMDLDLRMVLPLTRPLWFWRVIADSGCSGAGLGRLHQSGVHPASEREIRFALLQSTETPGLGSIFAIPGLAAI